MWLIALDSSALLASSTAKRINVTSTIAPHGALNPAAPSTTVPFEQYWCKEFNAIELYGINASDKEYCLSLERSNYGTWAAANHTSITYNGGGGEILKRPDWWEPKLTQPCCGTLCQIVADAVEIYSWPIPVAYPNISTTMAPDKLNQ